MTIRPFCLLLIVFASITGTLAVHAGDDPLRGQYRLRVDSDPAEQTEVTLHLRLFSFASEDLQDLSLMIVTTVDSTETLGSLPELDVPAQGKIDVEVQLTVPRHEYLLWAKGASPKLLVAGSPGTAYSHPFRINLTRNDDLEFGGSQRQTGEAPVEIQRQSSTGEVRP